MQPPAEIVSLLASMANDLAPLALAWHLMIVAVTVVVVAGWRPPPRVLALLLVPLVLSVGIAALAYGNIFNGASFGVLAIALAVLGDGRSGAHVARGSLWSTWLGIALILFGACYPHFVEGTWYRVLAAAPVGVVPCATLAVVAGITLVADGFGSRAIPAILALWCGFYGLFGVAQLGVMLDVGVLVSMIGLVAMLATKWPRGALGREAPGAVKLVAPK